MFMESYAFCPFCGSEIEEHGDFPPPDQWEPVIENGEVLCHYVTMYGTCENCKREWKMILGEPDDFSASHNNEVLSIHLNKR